MEELDKLYPILLKLNYLININIIIAIISEFIFELN